MSVYHSSFNYLGINSRLKNLIIAHFEADTGEVETGLSMEPLYTDSSLGLRRFDYGAKYNSVATFRITVVKPDGSDFLVDEVRNHLKWLTGTYSNTTLELLVGEQIKCVFNGRFTNAWQQKMDSRIIGLVLEFTNSSPFAYSSKQIVERSISDSETFQIYCSSDDLFSSVYLKTIYENKSGSTLIIKNETIEESTEVKGLSINEVITIDGPMSISSDKQSKMFGDTFNFVFPRLNPGINEITITGTGNIKFEYCYPIKIGDVAVDIEELNNSIDCDSNPDGFVLQEYPAWENILNKPTTLAGFGITDAYTKTDVDERIDVVNTTIANTKKELNDKIDETKTDLETQLNNAKDELSTEIENTNTKIDNVKTELENKITDLGTNLEDEISDLRESVYTKEETDEKIESLNTELNNEISNINTALNNKIDTTKSELNNVIENLVNDLDNTNVNLNNTNIEVNNLKEQINNVNTELSDTINTVQSDLESDINAVKESVYTKEEIDSKLVAVYGYKGSVASISDLPVEGVSVGDVYNLEDTGMNVAWNGSEWDNLGSTFDLSPYLTKESAETIYATKEDINNIDTYTKAEIDSMLDGSVSVDTYTKPEIDAMLNIDADALNNMLEEVLI